MTVSAQNQVYAPRFQDRQDILADFDQFALIVRVVITSRIGRMMEKHDEPFCSSGVQVILKPLDHCGIGSASARH